MSRLTYDPSVPHEWELVGDVLVTITNTHGDKIPLAQWDPFIATLQSEETTRLFALVIGAATIDATQRKTAADTFRGHGIMTAVVSDDRMTRGVLTALSWLGADVKAFRWADAEDAVKHISEEPATSSKLREVIERVRALQAVVA